MVLAQKRPAVPKFFIVPTQQRTAEIIDFRPDEFSFLLDEGPPEEVYEPTAEDEEYLNQVFAEQFEKEIAEERLEQEIYARRMEELDRQTKAESILDRAGEVLEGIKYVCFVSRSKGRYHSGSKIGQQRPRNKWVEIELVSRGVEAKHYVGNSFRRRVYWPANKFPWDECADERGMSEREFMSLVPTLTNNKKEAGRYMRTGRSPDYRNLSVVGY